MRGEHFYVVHNPLAANSLSSEALPFGEEYRVKNDTVNLTGERKGYQSPDPFEHLTSDSTE